MGRTRKRRLRAHNAEAFALLAETIDRSGMGVALLVH